MAKLRPLDEDEEDGGEIEEADEEMETKEQKKIIKEAVQLTQIVTATDLAYKLPDGTIATEKDYLVWLGNQIWEIKKAVA